MRILKINGKYTGDTSYIYNTTSTPGVHYSIEDFAGQCGANILCDFAFYSMTRDEIKRDAPDIMEAMRDVHEGDVAKLMASAVVDSALDDFLQEATGWQVGSIRINPNSGNRIRMYEYDLQSR